MNLTNTLAFFLSSSALALVGCGTSTLGGGGNGGSPSMSTSSTSMSTSSTSGSGGGACMPPAHCATTSVGSGGAGGGTVCGGLAGIQCAADEYCNYEGHTCGKADGTGVCITRPAACDQLLAPACACDGKIYDNTCWANFAGFDQNDRGGCKAPAGMFGCGAAFCHLGTQYCERDGAPAGGPSTYFCKPLPTACGGSPSCACLPVCGTPNCKQTADGGFEVNCNGV